MWLLALALAAGLLFIVLLTGWLSEGSTAATILLDRQSRAFSYPFTIQNLMHLIFFVGLGELFVRVLQQKLVQNKFWTRFMILRFMSYATVGNRVAHLFGIFGLCLNLI